MDTSKLNVAELARHEAVRVSGGLTNAELIDIAKAAGITYVRMVVDPVGSFIDACTYWW
jgi:hypothetical protein